MSKWKISQDYSIISKHLKMNFGDYNVVSRITKTKENGVFKDPIIDYIVTEMKMVNNKVWNLKQRKDKIIFETTDIEKAIEKAKSLSKNKIS